MVEASKAVCPTIKLNSGYEIPQIGYGLFMVEKDQAKALIVEAAVKHGYRHFDGAKAYGNEEALGEAIKEIEKAGIKREELFITTKLIFANNDMGNIAETV